MHMKSRLFEASSACHYYSKAVGSIQSPLATGAKVTYSTVFKRRGGSSSLRRLLAIALLPCFQMAISGSRRVERQRRASAKLLLGRM